MNATEITHRAEHRTEQRTERCTDQNPHQTLLGLLERLLRGDTAADPFPRLARLDSLLHNLPLAADEFALARNRVQNARRYFQSREVGAARYELRFIQASLRIWVANQAPVEPRRRLRRAES